MSARRTAALAAVVLMMLACGPAQAQSIPGSCAMFSTLSATANGAGDTNGRGGSFTAGDVITVSATLGTATAATFSIVGSATGTPVYSGPAAAPATLTYQVPTTGMLAIGWYVNSANGTVNIATACTSAGATIPTLSQWAQLALGGLLLAAGAAAIRRRR